MPESKKRQEKFERFWKLIQDRAEKEESRFFMECGEGREFETDEMFGEDISGWLVPGDQADDFNKEWRKEVPHLDAWADCVCIAEWTRSGDQIDVHFMRY